MNTRKKICFVIQRYGLEVNGGAELHCRQLAEQMKKYYEVEVLTTKAKDHSTWKNEYNKDVEIINGIKVYRYSVEYERNIQEFGVINQTFSDRIGDIKRETEWLKAQGPYAPTLVTAVKEKKSEYDVFIFFTYLYYTTIFGIQEVLNKAILIPTAHDEPYIHMGILKDVFNKVAAIFYNTDVERKMVESIHHNAPVKNDIGGVGINVPDKVDGSYFKRKHKLDKYIIYVGRVDQGKLCPALIKYFLCYKKRNRETDLKLVFVGKEGISIPKHSDIISLGFVSDEEKFNAIAGATALILPSQFESLSMVVLEAMKLRIPVLINEDCAVVKSHCVKSNGGLYYGNYMEFEACLNYFLSHPQECAVMGNNGNAYAKENYEWRVIVDRLNKLIEYVYDREK